MPGARSVVVTGGASNIGRAICLAFAREGARVAVLDKDLAGAEATAAACRGGGAAAARAAQCDVSVLDSVAAALRAAEAEHGPCDVWVNCAGWVRDALFLDKPYDELQREVSVNLWGCIHAARAVLPGMVARRSGVVVTVASDAARVGEFREAVYSAAKAGCVALTKSLAREYGPKGVRLNAVCPGVTVPAAGEMGAESMWRGGLAQTFSADVQKRVAKGYPLRRLGTAADCAEAVAFLASERASFITGQTLSVSGGYSML